MSEAGHAVAADGYDTEPAPADSEHDLLLRYRDGDSDAFAELVDAYKAPIYAFLYRSGVSDGDTEDLFQEVFIKVHRNAHRFEAGRKLHPWIFTIVVNTTRSYFRARDRRTVSIEHLPIEAARARGPSAERVLGARETLERLEHEIQALPERHREALLLAVVENMPLTDIAVVLCAPVNTVKTWLRRARGRLIERLREESS